MSKKVIIIIAVVALVLIIAGVVVGVLLLGNSEKKPKEVKTYFLSLGEIYSNVKDSKKIVKVKFTIETTNEKSIDKLSGKSFIILDEVNKIIRNTTEDELQGMEGQTKLQDSILERLVELFENESITNVYFDEFITQ